MFIEIFCLSLKYERHGVFVADFKALREKYPVFSYDGYHIEKRDGYIEIKYDFKIENLCEFHPVTKIVTSNLNVVNSPDGGMGKKLVFALGPLLSTWLCSAASAHPVC